jgi:23S rRNA (guanosine2251-2'-O)-methyltransferase
LQATIDRIVGIHAVREAIAAGRPIQHVHFQQGLRNPRLRELLEECRSRGIPLRFEPGPSLDRLAQGGHHQGVVAVGAGHGYASLEEVLERSPENALLLLLDGVQDTHNLGALIRTACAAGAQAVVLPERRSAGLTPAAIQAASGAVEHVPVARVSNLARTLEILKERSFWIFGLDERGDKSYDQVDYRGNCALVVGGEGKGLHQLLKKSCDFLVRIPAEGKISTLNVSVAAGIVLFEAARQRRHPAPAPG